MPRLARAIAVGCAHHITQRGNNREDVFFVGDDRRAYLQTLAEEAAQYKLDLVGYCLMTNHVHLVAIPHAEDSLARAIGRTPSQSRTWTPENGSEKEEVADCPD
jgi:putative transposase